MGRGLGHRDRIPCDSDELGVLPVAIAWTSRTHGLFFVLTLQAWEEGFRKTAAQESIKVLLEPAS